MISEKGEYLLCISCNDRRLVKRLKPFGGALVKCEECGLVFRDPKPSDKRIMKHYQKSYSDIFDEEKYKSHRENIFLNFLEKAVKYTDGGKLLDVGCGYGTFLNLAKDKGWEVCGVELSKEACQFARTSLGLNVFCGDLKEASFPEGHFDVVTLWNVLDHMINPAQQLLEMRRILKHDGLLFLRFPNFLYQVKVRRIGEAYDKLFLGHANLSRKIAVSHLYAFSPTSVINLLGRQRFSIFRLRNSLPSKGNPYKTFPFLGERLIDWAKKGFFIFCELLYHFSSGKILWGPSLEVFATKEEQAV